jgi:hypothetical protein
MRGLLKKSARFQRSRSHHRSARVRASLFAPFDPSGPWLPVTVQKNFSSLTGEATPEPALGSESSKMGSHFRAPGVARS